MRAPEERPGGHPLARRERRREQWHERTLVELAGVLAGDLDVADLLWTLGERCAALLDAAEVGLLLAGSDHVLQLAASSSDRLDALELFELQRDGGPCGHVYRSGTPLLNVPLGDDGPWPELSRRARAAGYRMIHALPMRHGCETIGALGVLDGGGAGLEAADAAVAQALVDVASFVIVEHRALRRASDVAAQLQHALGARVVIEQAKGVLAERLRVDVELAFHLLREFARNRNERLGEVARRVVDGELSARELVSGTRRVQR